MSLTINKMQVAAEAKELEQFSEAYYRVVELSILAFAEQNWDRWARLSNLLSEADQAIEHMCAELRDRSLADDPERRPGHVVAVS